MKNIALYANHRSFLNQSPEFAAYSKKDFNSLPYFEIKEICFYNDEHPGFTLIRFNNLSDRLARFWIPAADIICVRYTKEVRLNT